MYLNSLERVITTRTPVKKGARWASKATNYSVIIRQQLTTKTPLETLRMLLSTILASRP
jgi:hypothetical protein